MTARDLRTYLQTHPARRFASLVDAGASPSPDLGRTEHEIAHLLVCPCGSDEFRLLGVAAAMTDQEPTVESAPARRTRNTGYVLRSMLRLLRELRMTPDEAVLVAPVMLDCVGCSARHEILVGSPNDSPAAPPALEAYRCRPCRRTTFEASLHYDYAGLDFEAPARAGDEERFEGWSMRVRCGICGREAEPISESVRGGQQRTLDSLYGRNDPIEAEPAPQGTGPASEAEGRTPLMTRSDQTPLGLLIATALALCVAAGCSDPFAEARSRLSQSDQARFDRGSRAAAPCAACHDLAGTATKIGPPLRGIADRRAGGWSGYAYSPALEQAAVAWNARTLDAFLAAPQVFAPGNRMMSPGVGSDQVRADLVFFLLHSGAVGSSEQR